MSNMTVTAVTVSLRVNDTNYGRGSERFVSLRGDVPEGTEGIPFDDYDQLLDRTLDLQLQAWEAIHGGRYVGGEVKAQELQDLIEMGRKRTEKIKRFLKQRGDNDPDSAPTEG